MKGGSRKEKNPGEERFKARCPTPSLFPFFVSSSDIFSVPLTQIKFSKVFTSLCFSISHAAIPAKTLFYFCIKTDL